MIILIKCSLYVTPGTYDNDYTPNEHGQRTVQPSLPFIPFIYGYGVF